MYCIESRLEGCNISYFVTTKKTVTIDVSIYTNLDTVLINYR